MGHQDSNLNRQFVIPYLKSDGVFFYRFRPGLADPTPEEIAAARVSIGYGGPVAMGEPELLTEFLARLGAWIAAPKPAVEPVSVES